MARSDAVSSDGAAFFGTVKDFELGENRFSYEGIRFAGSYCAGWVLLQCFDARLVDEESVVQDLELVVQHAEYVALKEELIQISIS